MANGANCAVQSRYMTLGAVVGGWSERSAFRPSVSAAVLQTLPGARAPDGPVRARARHL